MGWLITRTVGDSTKYRAANGRLVVEVHKAEVYGDLNEALERAHEGDVIERDIYFVAQKIVKAAPMENPPDDWEDCDQCGGCHPPGYAGDCRDDRYRWP